MIPTELIISLRREKYQLVGRHSAVKKCMWLHKSLTNNESCYKHKFYGVESWRCLQMTPAIAYCTLRCSFCWRVQARDLGLNFNESSIPVHDEPNIIVEGALEAQKRILSGYKSNPKIRKDRLIEAQKPAHAAISLAGEPTLYPDLGELIGEFKKRGLTTFLVTNGTSPKMLETLSTEPSQLYVSVCAPDEESFVRISNPLIPKAWDRLIDTLNIIDSFSCPTAVRLTLVKGLNLFKPEAYGKLFLKSNPTYIEAKAYVYVGMSRQRLKFENMPTHMEIKSFSEALSEATGYKIIDESPKSRVVLLSRLDRPKKLV